MCPASLPTATCHNGGYLESFEERYLTEFGFTLKNRDVIVDDVRVRGIGESEIKLNDEIGERSAVQERRVEVSFRGGAQRARLVELKSLSVGADITGPAILLDKNSTILVEPGSTAAVTGSGDIKIDVGDTASRALSTELDPIQLSIFSHRFMSTAEQMGRVLQRTSISVNIKERLDFSCAMFDAQGGLVANAPHIPVHLGAMQEAVKFQLDYRAGDLKDGDVLLTNHPCAGGSHLPDMTVITPVFYPNFTDPVFFVASRGHHADIGGLTPGSMPPMSQTLQEEGAAVYSFKLVENGVFDEAGVTDILMEPGKYPGNSGTRNLPDNISDLKAQVSVYTLLIVLVFRAISEHVFIIVHVFKFTYVVSSFEVNPASGQFTFHEIL
jgi:5-oxoprolinase (ATP-hydrolysing)